LNIKVTIKYPEDMDALINKAEELLANILVKKLQPKEITELITILQDESSEVTW